MHVGIPRNDLSYPRETSSLLPLRDSASALRTYLGQNRAAKTVQKLANNVSQAMVQLGRLGQAGFSINISMMHPFKIYQPTNYAEFSTGICFLGQDGTATTCNIDKTKPTDFTTIPPTVNPSESWRFWAVRTGQVEIRPIYSQNEIIGSSLNNWGVGIEVVNNTDGISPSGGSWDYDDPTTETDTPPLVIAGSPDVNGYIAMALWIKISMDTGSENVPGAAIAGINVGATQAGSHIYYPFNLIGPNLIPIGVILPTYTGDYSDGLLVQQFVFDHINNRYSPGTGNFMVGEDDYTSPASPFFSGGPMNFRGNYNQLSDEYTPTDLTSQVFYPGDCITIQSADLTDGFINGNMLYMYCGPVPEFWDGANSGNFPGFDDYWQLIFNSSLTS